MAGPLVKSASSRPMEKHVLQAIQKRIDEIQAANNFDVRQGVAQTHVDPSRLQAYGALQELIRLSRTLELDIQIPFDPSGVGLVAPEMIPVQETYSLYFARREGSTEWKIGRSKNAHKRRGQLQTGNAKTLHQKDRYIVGEYSRTEAVILERKVHRYLHRWRYLGRSKEWFSLTETMVKDLVKQLQTDDHTFLAKKL